MIRLSDNTKTANRRPWRRRISNQLAAFAAIMLFASTQVGAPVKGLDMNSAKPQVASQNVLDEIGSTQLELSPTLDQAASNSAMKSSGSKKKKTFKLNLFRFRH